MTKYGCHDSMKMAACTGQERVKAYTLYVASSHLFWMLFPNLQMRMNVLVRLITVTLKRRAPISLDHTLVTAIWAIPGTVQTELAQVSLRMRPSEQKCFCAWKGAVNTHLLGDKCYHVDCDSEGSDIYTPSPDSAGVGFNVYSVSPSRCLCNQNGKKCLDSTAFWGKHVG